MESSSSYSGPPEAPTTEMAPVEANTAVHAAVDVSGSEDRCSACAAQLAADQRYCVECGQPRRATRVPNLLQESERLAVAATPAPATRMSANTALIAGIGVLLLAMGIGVFIGSRAAPGDNGSQRFPGQVTVVSSGGSGGTAAAATPAAAAATPTAATRHTAATAPKKTAAKKVAASPAAASKPPPNAVHVGSAGSGPGYQNGKFTGNFFGGG